MIGKRSINIVIFLTLLISFYNTKGQDLPFAEKAYDRISLAELLKDLESQSELNFYFPHPEFDTTILHDVQSGSSIESILDLTSGQNNYHIYREGLDIYIFKGGPLVSELPEYEDGIPELIEMQTVSRDATGEKYIPSINISRDRVITVGRKELYVSGRKCRIRGMVRRRDGGEELIGATIYFEEIQLGAITDSRGILKVELPAGLYTMRVNHMSMKPEEYGVKVESDGRIDIEMEEALIELQEVSVTDTRRGNVEGMQMGFERITSKTMKEIPVVLGEKDILRVAQMLPGVQNVGEGSSGFNVRGGSPDQNMFYINGISVYNTSHLFGFFTAFSPDIVRDFSLYKNNIPAKYGGRIASVFEIETREGNKHELFFHGGISPITGHISFEGPLVKEKATMVASFRSTYSDWLLKRINNEDIRNSNGSFNDGTLEFNAVPNEHNEIKVFMYRSMDNFSLSSLNDYSYRNLGASMTWKHRFSKTNNMELSFANSNYSFSNTDKNNISEAYSQDYGISQYTFRADFMNLALEKHRLEFGLNSTYYAFDRGTILPFGEESKHLPIYLDKEDGLENAIYVSDEFKLLPSLNLLLGMRISNFMYFGPNEVNIYVEGEPKNAQSLLSTEQYGRGELVKSYTSPEPRAALNYRIGNNNSVKASYNRLTQYLFLLSNTISVAPSDQWKLSDYHLAPPVSDQVSAGYYQDLPRAGINFSVEVYRKWIKNILDYKDDADFISAEPIETQTLQGRQNSMGLELMIRKNTNRLTGWLSYTYSRSLLTVGDGNPLLSINDGNPYPSNYDRPHSLNMVSNYRISRRFSISANVVYTTGRPVTVPVALYYSEGQQYLLFSDRNEYRIPDYFRIDLSVNLEGNLRAKKAAHSFWMLNIYNLTGRDNAYSVFYSAVKGNIAGYKLSIFAQPILTLSWNFKFGNYNSGKL